MDLILEGLAWIPKNFKHDSMVSPKERIQKVDLDDPLLNYADGYTIFERWYVKVDGFSGELVAESSAVSPTLQPIFTVSSASISARTPPRNIFKLCLQMY